MLTFALKKIKHRLHRLSKSFSGLLLPVPCIVDIVVGNKERLQSTHKGNMRLGNLVFTDACAFCARPVAELDQ